LSTAATASLSSFLPRWRIITKNNNTTNATTNKMAPTVPTSAMIFGDAALPLLVATGVDVAVVVTFSVFACA
jgi:hypothetical protein